MKKMTRNEKVLNYMKEHVTITPLEAYKYLGTMRLSAAIYDLRKEGIAIEVERVRVKTRDGFTYVAQYSLAR